MIFQALDKQTGHLVALRRFFLPDEVITRLKEKEENGKTIFENGVEWLKSLDVPHLQKVVTGGFDDLDDTPYFVTEWVDGRKLTEAHEEGIFSAGEGEVFDGQARAVLMALPMEVRPAVCLEEERILVSRDDKGALLTTLLLSPRIFFGAKGGMEFNSVDRQEVLEALKERFPAGEVAQAAPVSGIVKGQVTPVAGQVTGTISSNTQPVLKSAQTSGGNGLLWGLMVALVAVLGVGGWLVFRGGSDEIAEVAEKAEVMKQESEAEDDSAEKEATEEVVVEGESDTESAEMAAVVEPEVAEPVEEFVAEPEVTLSDESQEIAAAEVPIEDMEPPPVMTPPTPDSSQVEEPSATGEGVPSGGAEKVVAGAKDYYTPKDLATLKKMGGKEVKFRGKVMESNESGGQKTLWYLDFGNYRRQPFVIFRHRDNPTPAKREDWDAFVGKVVYVKGTVETNNGKGGRGSGVWIKISKMDDVQLEPEKPKEVIYQFADLDDLRVVSPGEKVIFEGDFRGHRTREKFVYLLFKDGNAIVGRFDVGGPLSTQAILEKLEKLKGKKVRLVGVGASDENPNFQVVIQLNEQDGFQEAK